MANGQAVRERLPGEAAPDPCDFGCADGEPCFIEAGRSDPDTERIVRLWASCGGRERRFLPRPGGIENQDAEVAYSFLLIDGAVANAERTALARAAAAAKNGAG